MTAVEPFGGECPHGMEDPAWCSTCKNPRPRRTGHDVGPPVALGEQPSDDGDGVPLIVTDTGLRTPEQHAADIGHVLLSWSLAWPQQQAAPGGGLLIANGVPRLN